MQKVTKPNWASNSESTESPKWPRLELVNRSTISTEQAAYYLNRQPQTLREWACRDHGPLRPVRVNGRLGWPVAELRKLLGANK